MAFAVAASPSMAISVHCSTRSRSTTGKHSSNDNNPQKQGRVVGNFGHFAQVVRKDVEFIKKGIGKGVELASEVLRIPQLSKALDDIIWLRNLEDTRSTDFQLPSWPQPYYPELSGVDLFVADLKALDLSTK
ncbi:unnamed protein product [Ilex paraguariensis]|uniref:Uncharacterized protein n=1 Tax=Ilex paraguariensis TaxID=185542 RepID=A0ABC8QTT1_9AQUA